MTIFELHDLLLDDAVMAAFRTDDPRLYDVYDALALPFIIRYFDHLHGLNAQYGMYEWD